MGTFLKIVLVSILVISFLGCAGVKNEPSSSQKMLADMQQDLAQCRAENEALAKQTEVIKKEEQAGIKRLQNENLALALQVKELQDQLDKGNKVTAEAGTKKAPAQQSNSKAGDLTASKSKTRIKVLWGNGKPASAKKLAAKINSLGYKVEKTGTAARQNYKSNMVYYSKDAKPAAQKLAKRLKAEAKPLTWKSEFNILVVAGGK
jgi:Tfp pilus assembly protein PilX